MNIYEKEIDGIVYKAQFKGMAYALDILDKAEAGTSRLRISEKLFSEILVSPKVSIDDFADMSSYTSVYEFLFDVATGNFLENRPSKAKLKRKVRENWYLWRLVLSDRGFDFPTVFGKPFMTPQDVMEANIALDIQHEAEKKAARKKH